MENINPEINPEIETEETKTIHFNEFIESFKGTEGMDFVLQKISDIEMRPQESKSADPERGMTGNKAIEWQPESGKLTVYKEWFEQPRSGRKNILMQLLAEMMIDEGAVDLAKCQEIIQKYNLPFELEGNWIRQLKKPERLSNEGWQKYLLHQRVAWRLAAFLKTGDAFEMGKERLKNIETAGQEKLKKDPNIQKIFLNENKDFADHFDQGLTEFEREAPDVTRAEQNQESKPAKAISETKEVSKEESFVENILDDIGKIWNTLVGPEKAKKEKPDKLRPSWMGKLLMRIFDWFETQKAYRQKRLDICMDWGLQNNCMRINAQEDRGETVGPATKRILVRFNSLAQSESRGWTQYPLESGVGKMIEIEKAMNPWQKLTGEKKLTVLDIMERLYGARTNGRENEEQEINKIAKELNQIQFDNQTLEQLTNEDSASAVYQYWTKTMEANDIRDISGPMAALRSKCARFDEGAEAWEWLWTCNLMLWKTCPRPIKNEVVPRLEYGLIGSHQYSNIGEMLRFMHKQLTTTSKWVRYLDAEGRITKSQQRARRGEPRIGDEYMEEMADQQMADMDTEEPD